MFALLGLPFLFKGVEIKLRFISCYHPGKGTLRVPPNYFIYFGSFLLPALLNMLTEVLDI
jgi:hypothetical protein